MMPTPLTTVPMPAGMVIMSASGGIMMPARMAA
jgi:hypothetical protein